MSYILDALSKSQMQRERGAIPPLMTVFPQQKTTPPTIKYWLTAAICLLSIGMLVSGYALSGRAQDPLASRDAGAKLADPFPAPTMDSAPPASVVALDQKSSIANTHTRPVTLQIKQRTSVQNEFWPSIIDDRNVAENPVPRQPDPVAASAVMVAPEPTNTGVPDARLAPASKWLIGELSALERTSQGVEAQKQVPPKATQSEDHSTVAYAAASARAPVVPATELQRSDTDAGQQQPVVLGSPVRSNDQVPALDEMPRETRDSLPSMEINVHSYAETPEKRMVIINMKRYGEGDRMVEGPMIDAITQTGVVLVHETQRFRLPVR
jgi:hypothetical protein